jgi:DNA-binding transcriptional ArsR family regulator
VSQLRHAGWAERVREQLFPIAPHSSYFPDLLTPPEGALGIHDGLHAVLTTSRERLRREIGRLRGTGSAGGWLDDLAGGRPAALTELGTAMHRYYELAVAPHWSAIRKRAAADVGLRRAAANAGVDALLNSFAPMMRWTRPVLEVPDHPSRREVNLQGRGLLLVPSHFCRLHPVTIFDESLPQVVVYPVAATPGGESAADPGKALRKLLGVTRAEVLLTAVSGITTGDLADRLGVSAAVISHHTAILRAAGLIVTMRSAGSALHSRTPLGDSLIAKA